ncbi:TPA: thymidylate synthase [Patescibacteria group bacterium]|uniref:Thymidylate synthase n=1 Tax=Candidatus Gottesmanbacteria bacterium GW2011_GWA1_43_11 TaxID=1618436 RepID=A0A0G1CC94_9BACT|nr:MAG: Thymidylate synthase [Candidatus Gottesmanbacteria bacterium GW2011_GWA1_43_11]HCS78583.1 thymidylate synthase [Patescibacteria group bacterium]
MSNQPHPEYQYLNLLQDILDNGRWKVSHSTGVKLKSVFGRICRYDLSQGFPVITTKKVFTRGIIHELIWFLSGESNIKYLVENNVHIWDEWAYRKYEWALKGKKGKKLSYEQYLERIKTDSRFLNKYGDLGPVYGVQWRRWPVNRSRTVDQLGWAVEKIKKYPLKKHYIISAWNAGCIYEMSGSHAASMVIAPCHTMFHINITDDKLSLLLYQRSADLFLGVPFNIASYALLTLILAQVTGYKPGEFVHVFGDVHIYENHFDQVKEQLQRTPRPFPRMKLNPAKKKIDDFVFSDFEVVDYNPHPPIKGDITVVGGF